MVGATATSNEKTKLAIAKEQQYVANNYHPLPVVYERALGATVWDVDGKSYIDCLSAYSAVNQGHCHPKIVDALVKQASKLTLSSRAFHSDALGTFAEKLTGLLGYDRVLPMNTGAEAVETAMKLARKWAYSVKKVPANKAIILSCTDNFHGRTIGAISMSTDPDCRMEFGPFLERVGPICPSTKKSIRFNNVADLEAALDAHGSEVAAFIVEPIQGEAGIIVPDHDYLERVQALCRKHNVLLICDEIQTGFGRTGKMLCHQHNPAVKADIITLGKALSGGVFPVSAVMSSKEIMDVILPGSHGSTYGGNALAAAVSTAALDVLVDERLCERALEQGDKFRGKLQELTKLGADASGKNGWVTDVRGKGLLNAIVINPSRSVKGYKAWHVCLIMKEKGLLAKPTHDNIIRLAPPLVIEEKDLDRAIDIIRESLLELDTRDHIEDLSAHDTNAHFVSL